jgi:hypothetical protein
MMIDGIKCQSVIFQTSIDPDSNHGNYGNDHRSLIVLFQDSTALWPTINEVPVWKMLLVMVIGFTLQFLSSWIFVAGQKCILSMDQVGLVL